MKHSSLCQKLSIGAIEAFAIFDGAIGMDPADLFVPNQAPQPEADGIRQQIRGGEPGIHSSVLLLKTGRNTVLVDTGSGPGGDPNVGKLLKNLQATGIDSAEIDSIIFSHCHPDHIAGTLDVEGNPVFPNAHYYISENELAHWSAETVRVNSLIPEAMKDFVVCTAKRALQAINSRMSAVRSGQEFLPGIRALDGAGHSPGQIALAVTSGSNTLVHAADVIANSTVAFKYPRWASAVDEDRDLAATTRQRLLDQLSADRVQMFAPHIHFPGIGYVERRHSEYVWQPSPLK
ncbi:MBL fold metallo-hydrolase [Pseudorhodoplanes sp.]|uniref:MBL fold metallo-hydrolase n=1 Tax=Pseudorhodoplanes sp. TaxID=1934341 RepID=UPI003D12E4EB